MPCFFRTSAKASSASSWIVAIRSRPNWVSLAKVSSSKAINFRTGEPRLLRDWIINHMRARLFRPLEYVAAALRNASDGVAEN